MNRLRQSKSMSMRMKIILSCISCMLLALAFQTVLFYFSSSQIIYGQAQEIGKNTLDNLQEDIYSFNKNIENSLIKIYNQKQLIHNLSQGLPIDVLKSDYDQIAYELAHTAFIPAQNLTALYVYTKENQLLGSYRHVQTPKYTYPEDIFDKSMENNVEAVEAYIFSDNRVMLISSYYNDKREVNLIRYVLKIYRNTSEYVGYIVCDIDPKPFLQMINKYHYTDGQIIWLQPNGDRVALQAGELTKEQQSIFESQSDIIEKEGIEPLDIKTSGSYELFQAQEHKYNFTAYSLVPRAALKLNQTVLMQNIILALALILFVFSLLFVLISNGLTKPLTYMVETMSLIKKGKTGLRLKQMRKDEIGTLGHEFNGMLDEIESLVKKEYETKLLADNAKYKALQAQVNPHFLYNTLDTMSGIASAHNSPIVSTICRALSNVFRYSLDMENPFSTLEDEIVHIKNYMYIMNVRMNNSINMEIQIDDALLQEKAPRLSIQPLVENSIQHGLKNKRGKKEIRIGAKREDDVLHIWVEDNGVGMDAAQINKELGDSAKDVLRKSSSIGIDNINARLKLLYGNKYGVWVFSEPGKGSKVSLQIPIVRGGTNER